jgi:hypothetical protein
MFSPVLISTAITTNKIIALVVLIVVVGAVGFYFWNRSKKAA